MFFLLPLETVSRNIAQSRKQATYEMKKRISQAEYDQYFAEKQDRALEHALEIRKFEIDLYWRRATYFWTFIGATLAAYGAVQAIKITPDIKPLLSLILACLGFVFSFAWFFVNKGSKQWQENWENHVDLLEDKIIGPLYKTTLDRLSSTTCWGKLKDFVAGPGPFSVSKINQIISLFVTLLWMIILIKSLNLSFLYDTNYWYLSFVSLATLSCIAIIGLGRTDKVSYEHRAWIRDSKIHTAYKSD